MSTVETVVTAIGTGLVFTSAVLAWTFCVFYHLSARWWSSEPGRHLMTFTAVLAAVLTLWTIGLMVPTRGLWWGVLRLITFAGVPVGLGWRLRMLWRVQIKPGLKTRTPDGS